MRSQRNSRGAIDPLSRGNKLILNNYKEDVEIFSKTFCSVLGKPCGCIP